MIYRELAIYKTSNLFQDMCVSGSRGPPCHRDTEYARIGWYRFWQKVQQVLFSVHFLKNTNFKIICFRNSYLRIFSCQNTRKYKV